MAALGYGLLLSGWGIVLHSILEGPRDRTARVLAGVLVAGLVLVITIGPVVIPD